MSNLSKGMRGGLMAAIIGLSAAIASPISAAEGEAPSLTTATFGQWTVRCRPQQDEASVCEMVQGVQAGNNAGTLANLALGRLPGDDALRMVIQLPIGINLSDGVAIAAGEGASANAVFETCYPNLCVAQATVTNELLDAFKGGESLTVAFKDRAKRAVSFQVSLDGFSAAYESSMTTE